MSEKLKRYTFLQQLQQGYIRVPRIQRGYAQGRKTKKVEDIRRTFLHTLFQVIKGKTDTTELDFVYGSMKDGAFEPLDGQQRLTTLFLIHWMLGVDLRQSGDEKKSVFTYASCPTSEDFSNELVRHDSKALIKEALVKKATPSELIKKREWFHKKWNSDPSISSMLVMIDGIYKELTAASDWENNLDKYIQNLDRITFNGLNLGDFGLSNELFIKMNARGKQLSEFDKMKSTLEEEIQIQESEKDAEGIPMASQDIEEDWRTLMDGRWSDYFWHTYARKDITEAQSKSKEERKKICLEAAKSCELQFKKLLLRLIQLQLHSKMPDSEDLREACYKRNKEDLDNLLLTYTDSLLALRSGDSYSVGASDTMIDFKELIDTINSLLIVADNGKVSDIYVLMPKETHINCDDKTLLQSFLEENVANDTALIFFATLKFLAAYPYTDNAEWLGNFCQWVKSMRNILANNNTNRHIDKRWLYENALTSIRDITADLVRFGNQSSLGASAPDFVHSFLKSIGEKTYTGLDNQSLKEEVDKAVAILDDHNWHEVISAAERDPYLWGQIRSLLDWGAGDLEKFRMYTSKLSELLEFLNNDVNGYYTAALKLDPYHWVSSNRLYQKNNNRDNSIKRYLRDIDKEAGVRAPLLKRMVDLWIETGSSLNAQEFIAGIKSTEEDSLPVWAECIIKAPAILDFSHYKRPYQERNHVIIAQLQTMDSHCIDPVLKYLHITAKNRGLENQVTFHDSKGDTPHSISYEKEDGTYKLEWSDMDGMYDLVSPEGERKSLTPEAAVDSFISLLSDNK